MKNLPRIAFLAFSIALGATPLGVYAQTIDTAYAFKRDGVFGCSVNASYAMSVGALGAVGGVYVPVNDAAVTLNTGYLVYKECVLDGVTSREKENATANLLKQGVRDFVTGRDGRPRFPVDLSKETLDRNDAALLRYLTRNIQTMHKDILPVVRQALARSYQVGTRAPNQDLVCSFTGSLSGIRSGKDSGLQAVLVAASPSCNPLIAFDYLARPQVSEAIGADQSEMFARLGWSQGLYGVEEVDENGVRRTLTPGILVAASIQQLLGSGFAQLESANEIDQIIGALFAAVGNQMISDSRGLVGLLEGSASQPSYLDRVVSESASGLRNAAVNAGLQILNAARQVEGKYLELVTAIGNALVSAIEKLRSAERACWNILIPKVQEYAKTGECTTTKTGTNPDGSDIVSKKCEGEFELKIATSTAFSQPVINSQIAPLASTTAVNIDVSQRAVDLVEILITEITNITSITGQRLALQKLDVLVSQRALHTQGDIPPVQEQLENVQGALVTLIEDTIKAWGDSMDPNVGWCNVNNPAVIKMWAEKWKKKT